MAGIVARNNNVRLYLAPIEETMDRSHKITHVVSIGEITEEAEEIDVTTLDSLGPETIDGDESPIDISIVQNVTQDEYSKMRTWRKQQTPLQFGLVVEDNSGFKVINLRGEGRIRSVSLSGMERNGLIQVTSILRVLNHTLDENFIEPQS